MRKVPILLSIQLIVTIAALQNYTTTFSSNGVKDIHTSSIYSAGVLTARGDINVNIYFPDPDASGQGNFHINLFYLEGNRLRLTSFLHNIKIPATPGTVNRTFQNIPSRR